MIVASFEDHIKDPYLEEKKITVMKSLGNNAYMSVRLGRISSS